jgi:hypothetical protein
MSCASKWKLDVGEEDIENNSSLYDMKVKIQFASKTRLPLWNGLLV